MEDSLGTKFIHKSEVVEIQPLKSYEVVCLYFGAGWCPPCSTFLPLLLEFYNEVNIENKIVEIIYVSRDKSKDEYEEETREFPWISLPFADHRIQKLLDVHEIKGIPVLIVLKKNGEVATTTGKQDVANEGTEALTKWQALV